jgi:hypothetical protein
VTRGDKSLLRFEVVATERWLAMSPSPVIVSRGLDLPITGAPRPEVDSGASLPAVALLARDFVGLQVRVLVEPGARVRLGQPLWVDRNRPEIRFTSPGSGVVAAIHRGEKRALLSTVVTLEGEAEPMAFEAFRASAGDEAGSIRALLLESGQGAAEAGPDRGRAAGAPRGGRLGEAVTRRRLPRQGAPEAAGRPLGHRQGGRGRSRLGRARRAG